MRSLIPILILASLSGCLTFPAGENQGIEWGIGLPEEGTLAEITWSPAPGEQMAFENVLGAMRNQTECGGIDGDIRYPGQTGSYLMHACELSDHEVKALWESEDWNTSMVQDLFTKMNIQFLDAIDGYSKIRSTGFAGLDMLVSNMYFRTTTIPTSFDIEKIHIEDAYFRSTFARLVRTQDSLALSKAFTIAVIEIAPQCTTDFTSARERLENLLDGLRDWREKSQGNPQKAEDLDRRISRVEAALDKELGSVAPYLLLYEGRRYYNHLYSEETHLPTWGEGMYIFNSLIRNANYPGVRETIELNEMDNRLMWEREPDYGRMALVMRDLDWSPIVADCGNPPQDDPE